MSEYEIKALTSDTWDAFAALASRHGGAGTGGCWCTWLHRGTHPSSPTGTTEDARDSKRGLVETGRDHAALVFDGGRVVGWAQYGSPAELPGIAHRKEYLEGPTSSLTTGSPASSSTGSPAARVLRRPRGRGLPTGHPRARRCRQHSCTAAPAPCSNGLGSSTSARRERITVCCGRSRTQADAEAARA